MRLTEGREECIVEFAWLLSREFAPPLPLLLDAAFASTLELGRRGTGQPLQVELKRNPVHCDIHEANSLELAGTACLLGYEDQNFLLPRLSRMKGHHSRRVESRTARLVDTIRTDRTVNSFA